MIGYTLDSNMIWRGGTFEVVDPLAPLPGAMSFTAPPGPYNPGALVAWRAGEWVATAEPPPPSPPVPVYKRHDVTYAQFMDMFTATERTAFRIAAAQANKVLVDMPEDLTFIEATLVDVNDQLQNTPLFGLDDSFMSSSLDFLTFIGVIAPGRKAVILSGAPPA